MININNYKTPCKSKKLFEDQFENCGSSGHTRGSEGDLQTCTSRAFHEPGSPWEPSSFPCFGTYTCGFLSPVSHLYFHTVLEANHTAQERRLLAPGSLRRISASLWSCPGPADTQSLIASHPLEKDLKKQLFFMVQQNPELLRLLFQSYFLTFAKSNIFTTLPKLFFPKNKRSKFQETNYTAKFAEV